jgi:hypothetical protein
MTNQVDQIVGQLDILLVEYEALRAKSKYDDLSDLPQEIGILSTRMAAALDRLAPPGSTYWEAADSARNQPPHIKLPQLSAIAEALRTDLNLGWTRTFVDLVHADTYGELLEMATDLLDAGYKDPAAVVAGTALETHLRNLFAKLSKSPSTETKADVVNVELKKTGIYGGIQQKQVTAWLGIRNAAAHGKYSDYGASDVKSLIDGVGKFADRYPA